MIKIKKHECKNNRISTLRGVSGRVVNAGTLSIDSIAKLCSKNNTVTRADALAVLDALFNECEHALKSGFTVSLGDLGTLKLTISNTFAETLQDWNVKENIKHVNIRYTPSVALREAINLSAEGISIKVID